MLNKVLSKAVPKTPFELWTGRKPSLRHLHVWGCPAEVRIYNPHEKKLDFRTISGFFIGYPEKSKGFRFYCPNHSTRIVETKNAKFIENGETSGSKEQRDVCIKKVRVEVPLPLTFKPIDPNVVELHQSEEQQVIDQTDDEVINDTPIVDEPQETSLRRSQRERKSAIPNDYVVYL